MYNDFGAFNTIRLQLFENDVQHKRVFDQSVTLQNKNKKNLNKPTWSRFRVIIRIHTISLRLTGVVFAADAGVPSFFAGAHAAIQAGVGIAQVDLRLAVIACEAHWAAAAQASDGMNGPEEDGGRRDEGGRAVEAQHRDALHVVLARLTETHVVIKWKDLG